MPPVSCLQTKFSIVLNSHSSKGSIPVIVLFAPTATGKTALVRTLFGSGSFFRFKGCVEVISADSQAVYRGLDVGTAKPTVEEQDGIPHHLINVASPFEQFGLGEFMTKADLLCKEIFERGHIPCLVGGTGFYIRSFLLGSPQTPESDPEVRKKIFDMLSKEGALALHKKLMEVDPESARRIHVNDEYRICRALEVYYTSGKTLSSFQMPQKLRDEYDFLTLILEREKEDLYNRINQRVDLMFEQGLEQEVENLKQEGCCAETPGMKAIGYREFFDSSLKTKAQICSRIKLDSRKYAKKQITFMRGIPQAQKVSVTDLKTIKQLIESFLSEHKVLSEL